MFHSLPLRWSMAIVGILGVLLGALVLGDRRDTSLHILAPEIDGDAFLVLTPDHKTILIDGGADGAALAAWLGNTLPLGQRHLDSIILTRSDSRTLPGQLAALKRYSITTAFYPPTDRRTSSLDAWTDLLQAQNVMPQPITSGDRIALGTCAVDVLTEHESRSTLALECAATRAYFFQSIDDSTEIELSDASRARATLVVFPWSRLTNIALLRQLDPAAIVFSENGESAPHMTWPERQVGDAHLFHETLHGQINIIDTGHEIEILSQRRP